MPEVFVAFGVTGDLMRLKILPALFALHLRGELPENFEIVGVSRREWSDKDLRAYVRGIITPFGDAESGVESFLERLHFLRGDVVDSAENVFEKLVPLLDETVGLLYLSLSPSLYAQAFEQLVQSSLPHEAVRLMIEKPFGRSGAEAERLDTLLHRSFLEEEIYRVDHYLGKESLAALPVLNRETIKSITIDFWEMGGIGRRGTFYDAVGALRDVGQNHLLEMFAMAVDKTHRAEALEQLEPIAAEEMAARTTRAQHEGYDAIPGIAENSQTETYFKIEARWRGVPVIFEAGKELPLARRCITVEHNDGSLQLFELHKNTGRDEYEVLILDCLHGNHSRFVDRRELAALWRFIDPIIAAWGTPDVPLLRYQPGTIPQK